MDVSAAAKYPSLYMEVKIHVAASKIMASL